MHLTLNARRPALPPLLRCAATAAWTSPQVWAEEIAANFSTKPGPITLKTLPPRADLEPAYPLVMRSGAADTRGSTKLVVPAQSVRVYILRAGA